MEILRASPGCTLTNGDIFGKCVCLGVHDSRASWREVADEVAAKMQAELEAKSLAEVEAARHAADVDTGQVTV